jgi:hypothetical protein
MRQYTRIQPQVKALCERHGIPYRQESVFRRFGRMLDVAVGRTSMRELEAFPRQFAATGGPPSQRADAKVDRAADDVADDALNDLGAVLGS